MCDKTESSFAGAVVATASAGERSCSIPAFPVLMRSIDGGNVVLFISDTVGTVVFPSHKAGTHPVGVHVRSWWSCTDPGVWERFTGVVTLKNA